ncbi:MerR family transcriptional regulator, partial [Mesorhizobium sp. M8A.F.Ca.ET.173.01.1.1]
MESKDTIRRSMPVFSMSVVTKLSELTARQV